MASDGLQILGTTLSGTTLVVVGIAWGTLKTKLDDLIEEKKKQNGRIGDTEKSEQKCRLDFERRITALETEAQIDSHRPNHDQVG